MMGIVSLSVLACVRIFGQAAPPSLPALPVAAPIPMAPAVPAIGLPPGNPGAFVWDAERKSYQAKHGEAKAHFTFFFTNISATAATISKVTPSCGCTTAKLPPLPWVIAAGTGGQIDFTMDLAGKSGALDKYVPVDTTAGPQMLVLHVDIPAAPPASGLSGVRSESERAANMQSALVDRQAIFKGDCARCHVEPTVGKVGKELYAASCGICHEAEHRAAMVPDLKALPHPTNAEFWKLMITSGKPGTLMPAFALKEGGNLSDEQIASLVQYLAQTIPPNAVPAATANPAKAN